jgi:hypothetical protein
MREVYGTTWRVSHPKAPTVWIAQLGEAAIRERAAPHLICHPLHPSAESPKFKAPVDSWMSRTGEGAIPGASHVVGGSKDRFGRERLQAADAVPAVGASRCGARGRCRCHAGGAATREVPATLLAVAATISSGSRMPVPPLGRRLHSESAAGLPFPGWLAPPTLSTRNARGTSGEHRAARGQEREASGSSTSRMPTSTFPNTHRPRILSTGASGASSRGDRST